MKRNLILLFTCASSVWSTCFSQPEKITYHKHIQPIIQKNCQSCHQPGKAGPFNLVTYDDVKRHGEFIGYVTKTKYMPPWKADVNFQRYLNERTLSDSSIALIQTWIADGMPEGKKIKNKIKPSGEEKHKEADLSVIMPEPFAIAQQNEDDYRFFNIPTNLPSDEYITKIEFIPGNPKLVHHSRLMTDTTHKVRGIQGLSANDPGISEFEKYPPLDKFLYGWVPGNFPIRFPKGTGKKLHRHTDIILNIHYSPNSRPGQTDQSRINFYFADSPVQREVYSLAIAEANISNPPFLIKANEKKTFYSSFGPIPVDISAIAVLPHLHYLGKTIRAFAITPGGEGIHLIKIDEWDFKWQDTYQFKTLLKIPAGSTIIMEATFDNTSSNPANPSTPPKDVSYGWNTSSEMMDLIIYYLDYRPEDVNFTYDQEGN